MKRMSNASQGRPHVRIQGTTPRDLANWLHARMSMDILCDFNPDLGLDDLQVEAVEGTRDPRFPLPAALDLHVVAVPGDHAEFLDLRLLAAPGQTVDVILASTAHIRDPLGEYVWSLLAELAGRDRPAGKPVRAAPDHPAGRPRNEDDAWARQELRMGRDRGEVKSAWRERNRIRARELKDEDRTWARIHRGT